VPQEEDVAILLFQAVRELLFNVAKHAGVKNARVEVRRAGSELRVLVADEGTGFDPSRIRTEGGLTGGFGLFSVRERVNYVGGHLEIDSAPGRGSRFTLVVPAGQAKVASPIPCAPLPASSGAEPRSIPLPERPRATRTRVLLADDHTVTRQGLARLLGEEPDIEVVGQAADGLTAITLTRQFLPDIVIMDVSMPGMSGIDATRTIHAELPGVKIIGLSMYEEDERGRAMREAGAVAYLTKSGPPEAVIAAVRAHAGSLAGQTSPAPLRRRNRRPQRA
jgi:CheY-like chemotaxis protein